MDLVRGLSSNSSNPGCQVEYSFLKLCTIKKRKKVALFDPLGTKQKKKAPNVGVEPTAFRLRV